MIITKTPFRMSFFGGGTDYPVWYEKHGGAVISASIDKFCYISLRYLPPFFEHKYRVVYSLVENTKKISEIKHSSVREILNLSKIDKGVEIHHDADLPARAGLGSSSAFTAGLLKAVFALKGEMISSENLAKEAIRIERDVLKENVGSQDQIAVSFGGFNKTTFNRDHSFKVEPMILKKDRLNLFQKHLMLYFTGISRTASEIASEQINNTKSKSKDLANIRQIVDRAEEVFSSDRDIREIGELLHESWMLKKNLSDKITNDTIESLYDIARENGALGGKVLGAGGGGFMVLFVPPQDQDKVRAKLKGFLEVKFSFNYDGSQVIYYNM